ncbi:MAG TPA: hypothetical protein PLW50_00555 [Smithellaceae bacterium]|nr:hypothetical protein [Smithellaceae bacterium]
MEIEWSENGVYKETVYASGYNGSLGGYAISHRTVAPGSGSITVTAKSANILSWTVNVSSTDTQAGSVQISNLTCYGAGASLAGDCFCGNAGTPGYITVTFGATATNVGNGMAYYDVYVDGRVVLENRVVNIHNVGERINDSVNVPCASAGSTISIKGKSDVGASVRVGGSGSNMEQCTAGTRCYGAIGQRCVNNAWVNDTSINTCGGAGNIGGNPTGENTTTGEIIQGDIISNNGGIANTCEEGLKQCAGSIGQICSNGMWVDDATMKCGAGVVGGTDIFATLKSFYDKNPMVSLLGIALLGVVVFSGGNSGRKE